MTPGDFSEVLKGRDKAERAQWERMRILAAVSISPYAKGGADPKKLIPMPWDGEKESQSHGDGFDNGQQRKEYAKKRLKELGY